MNVSFQQTVLQAEGRYLTDAELYWLELYLQSFPLRSKAYQILSEQADSLVDQALQHLARTHRTAAETYRAVCQRDLAYGLKYIARAVLTDDAASFQEDFALWMENIMRAVHKGHLAAQAYHYLKQEIQMVMPAECAALVAPYLDRLIMTFAGK